MSAMERLRKAGFIDPKPPQSDGYVRFEVPGGNAAIYVHKTERWFHVPTGPLRLGKFPSNKQLGEFVRRHGEETRQRAYRLACGHIDVVIDIILNSAAPVTQQKRTDEGGTVTTKRRAVGDDGVRRRTGSASLGRSIDVHRRCSCPACALQVKPVELPNERILAVMLDAYRPCRNFGKCREARWAPEYGQLPRGPLGATGDPGDVEVVMVFSEPGRPLDGERHDAGSGPEGLLRSAMQHTYNCYTAQIDSFHRNVRWFMSEILPGLTFDQQLHHVWLTEGRLCSIENEIGSTTDPTCASSYLVLQIKALPEAVVVAFGRKAQRYLRGIDIPFVPAFALSPPGANYRAALPSWRAAIEQIEARRAERKDGQALPEVDVTAAMGVSWNKRP